jgi:hypothetical protein
MKTIVHNNEKQSRQFLNKLKYEQIEAQGGAGVRDFRHLLNSFP